VSFFALFHRHPRPILEPREVRRADPDPARKDDEIIPAPISAMKAMGIIKDAEDIIYLGASHGITATHQEGINSELLRFVES
jgi:fibrillarin-like rRNA methylase